MGRECNVIGGPRLQVVVRCVSDVGIFCAITDAVVSVSFVTRSFDIGFRYVTRCAGHVVAVC
jgi:hypothetical protein